MLQTIIVAVLQFTWGRLMEWMRKRQLEQAKRKAEALEAYVRSKEKAQASEEEMSEILKKRKEAREKVESVASKLEAIQEFNNKNKE
jgi:hypothetical protein